MKMRSWTRAEPLDQGRDQGGTRRSSHYVGIIRNVMIIVKVWKSRLVSRFQRGPGKTMKE